MILCIITALAFVALVLADCKFYRRAAWPERMKYTCWPGSGFVAYFMLRRKKM